MSKAKPKSTMKPATAGKSPAKSNDKALIAIMLQYGGAIGTALTTYKLEPGGDCDRSGPIAQRAFARAYDCLARAAVLPAQTMEGLSAKARAVPFIFQDNDGGVLNDEHEAFLNSLAVDAKRLAEQAIEAERAAAKGGAS